MGVPILGTAAEDVDAAEDRELFDADSGAVRDPTAAGQHGIYLRRRRLRGSA